MIRALLDGRKTQTRRVAKCFTEQHSAIIKRHPNQRGCPYGEPGDRLWVRETFVIEDSMDYERHEPTDRPFKWDGDKEDGGVLSVPHYRATEPEPSISEEGCSDVTTWKPSIFMPRWACRIKLEIVGVRVERVQDISEADAEAEGCEPAIPVADERWVAGYRRLWDKINAKRGYGWAVNPFVWVVAFRLTHGQEGEG